MAEQQTFEGNKIKDLISENESEVNNYDGSVWTRTCTEEIIAPIEGKSKGQIPEWINGGFLLNGPGAYSIGDVMFNHVFDGLALLHRFNIVNGKATYQNRFIQSNARKAVVEENRIGFGEFGTPVDPVGNIFQRFLSLFSPGPDTTSDNTLVTIYPIGEDFYAMTETPKMRQFNPKTLETLDLVNLKDYTGIVFQPAHPVVAEDGSLYNIGLKMGSAGTQFIIFHIPNAENKFENMKIVAKFPPKRKSYPSYTHSFALTENFFVVIEQPFTMSVYELAKSIFKRTNFTDSFRWFEDEPVYVHLIDRKSGQIVHSFETETFFFFHTINAYEENGHVILDLTCYEGSEIVKSLMVENMRTLQNRPKTRMFTSRPLRYVFPLTYSADDKVDKNLITLNGSETKAYMQSSGTVLCFPEMLCDRPFEFGTLYYEKHYAKKYRYFYGVGMDMYSDFPGRLIKVDVETKKEWIWQEENVYPSEALFIPSPTATSEDDGVLVSALLRGKEDTNCVELLVLDAKTFKELGRSEFKDLPSPITKSFHGWFLNERK